MGGGACARSGCGGGRADGGGCGGQRGGRQRGPLRDADAAHEGSAGAMQVLPLRLAAPAAERVRKLAGPSLCATPAGRPSPARGVDSLCPVRLCVACLTPHARARKESLYAERKCGKKVYARKERLQTRPSAGRSCEAQRQHLHRPGTALMCGIGVAQWSSLSSASLPTATATVCSTRGLLSRSRSGRVRQGGTPSPHESASRQ
eukprot:scaffold8933_cov28-Phaeocystis_antarctica.AAC.2